ncbi:hypothetical protein CCACVL1_05617, partial [Corchorus capsularis]
DRRMHMQLHTAEFNIQSMSITHADTSLYQIKIEQNSKSEYKYLKPLIKIPWQNHFGIHNATSPNKTKADTCTGSLKCHIVQTHQ